MIPSSLLTPVGAGLSDKVTIDFRHPILAQRLEETPWHRSAKPMTINLVDRQQTVRSAGEQDFISLLKVAERNISEMKGYSFSFREGL